MGCRSTPGKNSGYAAWKLELCSSTAQDGPTPRITALTILFIVYTKGLKQNGPSKILTEADDGLRYKTSKDSLEAAKVMQQQLDPSGVSTLDLSSIQRRRRHCGARLTTEQQANQCQQSHWMELWLNEQVNEIPWDPLWQNADLQKTCGNNNTEQAWEFYT